MMELTVEQKYELLTRIIRETGCHAGTRELEGYVTPGEPLEPEGAMIIESWDEYQTWLEFEVLDRLESGRLWWGPTPEDDEPVWNYLFGSDNTHSWCRSVWEIGA